MVTGLNDRGSPVDEPSARRSAFVTLEVSDDGTPPGRAPFERFSRGRTPGRQVRLLRQAPGIGCIHLFAGPAGLWLCLVPPAGASRQRGGRATSGLSGTWLRRAP